MGIQYFKEQGNKVSTTKNTEKQAVQKAQIIMISFHNNILLFAGKQLKTCMLYKGTTPEKLFNRGTF